jgi:hypothetical protein
MDISILAFEFPSGASPFKVIEHDIFSGTGTTVYDIEWQPDTETWRLVQTEGRIPGGIPEVPEPSTLLLFGTTAAASLWRKRRS